MSCNGLLLTKHSEGRLRSDEEECRENQAILNATFIRNKKVSYGSILLSVCMCVRERERVFVCVCVCVCFTHLDRHRWESMALLEQRWLLKEMGGNSE